MSGHGRYCATAAVTALVIQTADRRPGVLDWRGRRWLRRSPRYTVAACSSPAECPVLDPVATNGHIAPCTPASVRAVVKGPTAFRVVARLEAPPRPVLLGVPDDQDKPGQSYFALTNVVDVEMAICRHCDRIPLRSSEISQRFQL